MAVGKVGGGSLQFDPFLVSNAPVPSYHFPLKPECQFPHKNFCDSPKSCWSVQGGLSPEVLLTELTDPHLHVAASGLIFPVVLQVKPG